MARTYREVFGLSEPPDEDEGEQDGIRLAQGGEG